MMQIFTDDEMLPFLRNRAHSIGAPDRFSEDDSQFQITAQWESFLGGIHGCVTDGRESHVFSMTSLVSRALFMQAVDEIIIAAGLATPEALSTTGEPNERNLLPPDTVGARLANHLWRGEAAFEYHRGPEAKAGDALWRPINTEAGFYALAMTTGLFGVNRPISSMSEFRKIAEPTNSIFPLLDTPDLATKFFALEEASGTCRVLAKTVDRKVTAVWGADEAPEISDYHRRSLENYMAYLLAVDIAKEWNALKRVAG